MLHGIFSHQPKPLLRYVLSQGISRNIDDALMTAEFNTYVETTVKIKQGEDWLQSPVDFSLKDIAPADFIKIFFKKKGKMWHKMK